MPTKLSVFISFIFGLAMPAFSLEPENILIIANSDIAASVEIAKYYCKKRCVPEKNILTLPLGTNLSDTITRNQSRKTRTSGRPTGKTVTARKTSPGE